MTQYIAAHLKHVRLERAGRPVLRNVNWSIRPGERWVLLGGNGAGKTQLLKLLAGAVWPTPTGRESRRYRWRGETWTAPYEIKEEIAYVGAERQDKYQRYGWNHRVAQVIGTGLQRTDIPLDPPTPRERHSIQTLLKRLGIAHLATRRFLSLSHGERRLALLVRALAARPKLLLLDEPFNGLDENSGARVLRWLEHTARSELPWVLATHRSEEVPEAATHVLVLDGGRVTYQGVRARAPLQRWLGAPGNASGSARARPRQAAGRSGAGLPQPLVRLARASVHLDGTAVLRDISFELRDGECWVVRGPNGSGKSTLLRAIYGTHAVAGRIERAGIEPGVPLDAFKRRIGWIAPHLQASHPLHLTVAEVVQSGRYASVGLNDAPTAADRAAARRTLAFFGLTRFASRPLRELSYGQLRRVLFARAWVRQPQLLLLDEPFAGVDAPTRTVLLERIEKLSGQGVAVVMATHHLDEWPRGTTHELVLRGGRAVYCGPVRAR